MLTPIEFEGLANGLAGSVNTQTETNEPVAPISKATTEEGQ